MIFGITPLLSPLGAIENGADSLDGAIDRIDEAIDDAVAQGCVGFKNVTGSHRSLEMSRRTYTEARSAFAELARARPSEVITGFLFGRRPVYGNSNEDALRLYEDFVIHHLIQRASELGLLQLIHAGAQYSPNQNLLAADPALLIAVGVGSRFGGHHLRKSAYRGTVS